MDGFVELVYDLLVESGLSDASIFRKSRLELPGYFRPTKEWDILVVIDGILLASLEFKSQVGSFGNNYNNRTEEALGNATDLRAAYREGAFKPSPKPWLGYLMLLEEAAGSTTPVGVAEPHFKVFDEFRGASYAKRYEVLCQKLVREGLYDAACFILSARKGGSKGAFKEPNPEIGFQNFAASLTARAIAHARTREKKWRNSRRGVATPAKDRPQRAPPLTPVHFAAGAAAGGDMREAWADMYRQRPASSTHVSVYRTQESNGFPSLEPRWCRTAVTTAVSPCCRTWTSLESFTSRISFGSTTSASTCSLETSFDEDVISR